MEKITTKTKILLWGVIGEKEKIDFDLCDFSSEQVGTLDRLVRIDGDNKVRMTIVPEQKGLQITAITAEVGLVSLSCREKGQKLKVRGFKSPDERATALKRMSAADTPILLTIEEIQGSLFGKSSGPATPKKSKEVAPGLVLVGQNTSEELELKFKGLKGCKGLVSLRCQEGQWYGGYALQLGNQSTEVPPEDTQAFATRLAVLMCVSTKLGMWLDSIILTGTADQKRAMTARRDSMRGQVQNQLEDLIGVTVDRNEELGDEDEVPLED